MKSPRPGSVRPAVMKTRDETDAELCTVPLSVWIELDAGVLAATLNRCSPPIPGELRLILQSLVRDMQDMAAAALRLEQDRQS